MIDLVPSMTVMETKTDFVNPSFSSLMSSFGGALGLWLGLGIIQLVQVSHNYYYYYCQDHVMSSCVRALSLQKPMFPGKDIRNKGVLDMANFCLPNPK